MIKEAFDSLKDYIKTRTANPFFGTLIIVWIIKNWRLVYSTFNFDSETNLNDKIIFLAAFFSEKSFLINLLYCIGVTFIVLIVSYILINISRFIVNLFDDSVTPFIYSITNKSSIVLKSEYERILKQAEYFQKRMNEEIMIRLSSSEKNTVLLNETPEIPKSKTIEQEVRNKNNFTYKEELEIEKIVAEIISNKVILHEFSILIDNVALHKLPISNEAFKFAMRFDLIERKSNSSLFEWTLLGKRVKKKFLLSPKR